MCVNSFNYLVLSDVGYISVSEFKWKSISHILIWKKSDEIFNHAISEVTKWIVLNVVYCGVAKQRTVRVNKWLWWSASSIAGHFIPFLLIQSAIVCTPISVESNWKNGDLFSNPWSERKDVLESVSNQEHSTRSDTVSRVSFASDLILRFLFRYSPFFYKHLRRKNISNCGSTYLYI